MASLLDEDEEEVTPPPQRQEPIKQTQPKNDDPFDILGLDIGGSSQAPPPPKNNGAGDLLGGFSFDGPSQPTHNSLSNMSNPSSKPAGGDLLDGDFFGNTSLTHNNSQTHSEAPKHVNPPPPSSGGFDIFGGSQSPAVQNPQPGFNFNQPSPQQSQPQPQNNDSFKFKAYENQHLEIWMEGRREGGGNTKIHASFMNKTQSYIDQLNLQSAVMKYLKITIQPLTGTNLPPSSKGAVTQQMQVTNSAMGEKPIVMKIKLSYGINGQKQNFEAKIDGFPNGF